MTLSISDGNRTYTTLEELIEYAHEYCKNLPSHYGIDNIEDVELCHSVSMNNWYYRICLDGGNTYREEPRDTHQVIQSDSVPREKVQEFVDRIYREGHKHDEQLIARYSKQFFNITPNTK